MVRVNGGFAKDGVRVREPTRSAHTNLIPNCLYENEQDYCNVHVNWEGHRTALLASRMNGTGGRWNKQDKEQIS